MTSRQPVAPEPAVTVNEYRLESRRRRHTQKGKGSCSEHYFSFPEGCSEVSHWKLTSRKLRELCDAATDALDGDPSIVGPFHTKPQSGGIEVNWVRPTRTLRAVFETAGIEKIIASADELLAERESN
ncbi:hypothetical protein [Rhodococcus sp. NPDC060176]|uniref:hypothetical protein n=1 Tax=Rhodococcus sp. NPDC060176 TaxID=3347062 RepID=UPI0036549BFF